MPGQQIRFPRLRERATAEEQQRPRRHHVGRLHRPHEEPRGPITDEAVDSLTADGEEDATSQCRREVRCLPEAADPSPVVAGLGAPPGSRDGHHGCPGTQRRLGHVCGHGLGKGVGRVDDDVDVLAPEELHQPGDTAEATHPGGDRGTWDGRVVGASGERVGHREPGRVRAELPGQGPALGRPPDHEHPHGPRQGRGGRVGHPAILHYGGVNKTAGGRAGQLARTGLRAGWTTGACATAATRAAYLALVTGTFPDPVTITLPKGQQPAFALAQEQLGAEHAMAAVVKDAGDDPDVTHGALVRSTVRFGEPGSGVRFVAGPGVGTVTLPGLPLDVGEPAINPVPRSMMRQVIEEESAARGSPADVVVEISVDHGEEIARHTWNPRLGILGGLSILGTTGVVVPYSCSAWIDSIRRGIDVAGAIGHRHVAACTGSTSERTVVAEYALPETALLDMGDFAGAVLKYLKRHPIPRLTIAGGFAKLSKLAAGHLDLHSGRSQVDLALLSALARQAGADDGVCRAVSSANTGLEALQLCADAGVPLGDAVAVRARDEALAVVRGASTPITIDVVCIDRAGAVVGRSTPGG